MNVNIDVEDVERVRLDSLEPGDGFRYCFDDEDEPVLAAIFEEKAYGMVIDHNPSFNRVIQDPSRIIMHPVYVVGLGIKGIPKGRPTLGIMNGASMVFPFEVSVNVSERKRDE